MGAKKKGKANKLAKMSEEERIRYLQHRAAIEEEARRRKEQLISTFMKNKLKKEEIFSRLNMAKINQQWRQTLRQIKCVELKQDLEDLFKWFDYSATKKNRIIETLLDDLDEAESQYSRMHHCHTETIDKLIRLHSERIQHFYEQYKQEKTELHSKAKADLNDIINSYTTDEEHLQAILYTMEKTCEEKRALVTSQRASKIDEIRNNMLTDLENLKNSRESQIEKVWNSLLSVLTEYWEQTEDRRRQYLMMRETDYEKCRQIFENNQQINMLNDTIKNLRDQLTQVHLSSNENFEECKANKETARELLFTLKKKVSEENENDKQKLIFMNTIATDTTNKLQQVLAKGEQILQLQSLCRKLETLDEKICPEGLDGSQLTEEEETEILQQAQGYVDPLAEKAFEGVAKLNGFWKRYNRALLEKEALALHLKSLQNEQKDLKTILKAYLSDIVIKRPESKVSHANGIRIRHRPQSLIGPQRKSTFSTITCIEATQSPSIRQLINAQTTRS